MMLPASFTGLAHRPWTLLTYMVSHYDVWHILMNMMWLYFFGAIMLQVSAARRLVMLYLAGGLAGGLASWQPTCLHADARPGDVAHRSIVVGARHSDRRYDSGP